MSLRLLRLVPLLALLAGSTACTPNIGDKCTLSTDCSQLGDRLCDTTQPDGYCTVFACEPDQCPNSICVAFDPELDPTCGAADIGRTPRFYRSFCLAPCSSNSGCRDQYECVDLSQPANQALRRAQVVDLGAGDGGLGFSVCMAATCGDGIQDAKETDVDCGGTICTPCGNGKHCGNSGDCASQSCQDGYCVGPSCTNGAKDGTETDIDCGGPDCGPCSAGRVCAQGSDCFSGLCDASSRCLPGDCRNGQKDGAETDVDCGGGGCQKCGVGQGCNSGSDCASANDCVLTCSSSGTTCSGDSQCMPGERCDTSRCEPSPPPVCMVSDAGTLDGSVPWTPYEPSDAGTD